MPGYSIPTDDAYLNLWMQAGKLCDIHINSVDGNYLITVSICWSTEGHNFHSKMRGFIVNQSGLNNLRSKVLD